MHHILLKEIDPIIQKNDYNCTSFHKLYLILTLLKHNHGSHTDWKTWTTGKTFSSFCTDWKSQGNFDKILEKSGKFRQFLFFV